MSNTIIKWCVFVYGIILIVLGLVGYAVVGSIPSVAMGAGFGLLLVLCSLLMFMEKRIGTFLATLLTLLLAAFFAIRYSMTRGLLPALLAVLSGAMLIILLLHHAKWKKK